MISCFLLCRFLCSADTAADDTVTQPCLHNKLFQMIRSLFSHQFIMQSIRMMGLNPFL